MQVAMSPNHMSTPASHEMSVDAGSHVAEPHVHTGLTASGIRSLWAYKGSDESFLLLYTLIRQKMLHKRSCSIGTFIASDGLRGGSRGSAKSSEKEQELHIENWYCRSVE